LQISHNSSLGIPIWACGPGLWGSSGVMCSRFAAPAAPAPHSAV
jgi:hypothetical protein